jgi:hypothetical protein
MAVAVLTCERLRADLAGCPGAPLSRESSDALALAPEAATWACRYTRNPSISQRGSVGRRRQPSSATPCKASRAPAYPTRTRSCTTCWLGQSRTVRPCTPRSSGVVPLAVDGWSRPGRRVRPRLRLRLRQITAVELSPREACGRWLRRRRARSEAVQSLPPARHSRSRPPGARRARVLIVGKERNATAVAVASPPATTLMPRRKELDCAGWFPVRFLRPWEGRDCRSLDRTWLGSSRWPEPQHRHGTRWPTVVSISR